MLHIICSVLLSLVSTPPSDTVLDKIKASLFADGFSESTEYQPSDKSGSDYPLRGHLTVLHQSAKLTVSINLSGWPLPSQEWTKEAILNRWLHGNAVSNVEGSISGVPVGEHCVIAGDGNAGLGRKVGATAKVICDRYYVEVQVVGNAATTSQEHEQRWHLARRDCEKITRRVVGEAIAMDLNDDGTAGATSNLTGLEVDKRGMAQLATWAQNRGISVTYDSASETATFAYHGKQVKLPLASNCAIVDGRTVTLGGKFTMARGGRWFVPGAELAAAVG